MPNITYGSAFNANTTYVPGLYQQVIPPAPSVNGAVTAISFVVGTRSWGKLNSPQLMSLPSQANAVYGGIGAPALTDPHDLCTDVTIALGQGNPLNGVGLYAVGVGDGSETQAASAITDTLGNPVLPLLGKWTGIKGNQLSGKCTTGGPGPDQTLTFSGTFTVNDVVALKFVNGTLPTGTVNISYTVVSGDTTATLLATHVAAAINANATLQSAGFTATSALGVVTISWPSSLQSVVITPAINGATILTIGGSITATDVLTLKVLDSGLPGGQIALPYTVQGGDTTTTIATALKNAVNANTLLAAAGITATSSAAVVTLKSVSANQTTYTKTNNVGATETMVFTGGPTELVASARVPSIQLQIVPFPGGGNVETYAGLSGVPANFPAAAAAALSSGLNSARGPSNFVVPGTPAPTANGPLLNTFFTFSGGTDGRNVTSSELVGNSAANPATGIYTAQRLQFQPTGLWIAGLTDQSVYNTIQQFCDQNNIAFGLTFAAGTSTADAVAAKYSYGITDYQCFYFKDWQYFSDTANGVQRLVSPVPYGMGAISALPPWNSPLNVAIKLTGGTERDNPITGSVPYTYDELNSLGQAGIMLLENQGGTIVFENGYNSVGNNDPTSFVEYTRMVNYICATNALTLNQFKGLLTTFKANDAVRGQMATVLNQFFQELLTKERIGGFAVTVDPTNNPNNQLAQHEVAINEQVTFLPSIQTIFSSLQGGTTVITPNQGS